MLKLSINKPISFVLLVLLILAGCKKNENPIPVKVTDLGISSPEGKISRLIKDNYYDSEKEETTTPKVVLEDGRFRIYAGFGFSDSLIFAINGNNTATYFFGKKQDSYARLTSKTTLGNSDDMGNIVVLAVDKKNKTISGHYTLKKMNTYDGVITGKFNKIKYTEKTNPDNTFSYKVMGKFKSLAPTITLVGQKIYIEGTDSKSGERISITINGTDEGNYYFGSGTSSTVNGQASVYSDGRSYAVNQQSSDVSGFFQLSEVDLNKKTVTGYFAFGASSGSLTTAVTEGVIVKAPYSVSSSPLLSMSASIGNTNWSAQNISAELSGSYIDIIGVASNGSEINLNFPRSVIPGSYSLYYSNSYSAYYHPNNGTWYSAYYYSNSNLNIQNHDKVARTISGTFYFSNSYSNITNGSFSVKY
jgi:hypothetical protein